MHRFTTYIDYNLRFRLNKKSNRTFHFECFLICDRHKDQKFLLPTFVHEMNGNEYLFCFAKKNENSNYNILNG